MQQGAVTRAAWRRWGLQEAWAAYGRAQAGAASALTYGPVRRRCTVAAGKEAGRPKGFWMKRSNRKELLDRLAAQHGVQRAEDWRRVKARHFAEAGGRGMLSHYRGSVFKALQDLLEGGEQLRVEQVRANMPLGHWAVPANRKAFLDRLAADMGITQKQHWSTVSYQDVVDRGGRGLLAHHSHSLLLALQEAYPEQGFEAGDMATMPRNHWASRSNRQQLLRQVAERHSVTSAEDWKRVTTADLTAMGASSLFRYYDSVHACLQDASGGSGAQEAVYDVRRRIPARYWDEEVNVRHFMLHLRAALGIQEAADWYRVSHKQLEAHQAAGLLRKMSLADALRCAFPKERWQDEELTAKRKRAAQRTLRVAVDSIFEAQ